MIYWWDPYPSVIDGGRLEDAEDLSEIHATCFHRGWAASELEAMIADDRVTTVVARRGSPFGTRRPVGFVMVRAADDEGEVLTLAVLPRQRRRGLGRRLMDEAIRRLYHDRIRSLFLEVDEGNQGARTLYGRLGFREVGRRANYYVGPDGARSAALVMRGDLT